jgi:murein DD-endopeptidase MepM/ murein hydrolase activator NlpD
VRGLATRTPWRREGNQKVGSWGWTRKERFHAGVDLVGHVGERVVASVDGKAVGVRSKGKFGNYVKQSFDVRIVNPPERPRSCEVILIYAHLKDLAFEGEKPELRMGQTIGTMGRTGYDKEMGGSIPTHLHLELWLGRYMGLKEYRELYTRDVLPLLSHWHGEI